MTARRSAAVHTQTMGAGMLNLAFSTSNIFISLVLGALMLAFVGVTSPETLSYLIGWARSVKGALISTGIAPKYNVWIELLLEEKQLIFMFFTILARILMAAVVGAFRWLIGR